MDIKEWVKKEKQETVAYREYMDSKYYHIGISFDQYKIFKINLAILESSIKKIPSNLYKKWLNEYIKKGNLPTHYYDYSSTNHSFYIAISDLEKPIKLCGALSKDIIVPIGINVQKGDWGHCNFYYMDMCNIPNWIPFYKDFE